MNQIHDLVGTDVNVFGIFQIHHWHYEHKNIVNDVTDSGTI